jgi:hypothetical protein
MISEARWLATKISREDDPKTAIALVIALIAVGAGGWFAYYRPAQIVSMLPQEISLYYPDADTASILFELTIENTGARAAKIDTIALAWDYVAERSLKRFETQKFLARFETQEELPSQSVPFKPILLKGGDTYRRRILFTEQWRNPDPLGAGPRPFTAGKHRCALLLHEDSEESSGTDFTLDLTLDDDHSLEDSSGKTALLVKITPISR